MGAQKSAVLPKQAWVENSKARERRLFRPKKCRKGQKSRETAFFSASPRFFLGKKHERGISNPAALLVRHRLTKPPCSSLVREKAFFLRFLDFPGALRTLWKRAKKAEKRHIGADFQEERPDTSGPKSLGLGSFFSPDCYTPICGSPTNQATHTHTHPNRVILSDGPTTTTTILEFISRGPVFHFWGTPGCRTKCPFYTMLHRENTKIFHLMCHQMPF